MKSEQRSLPLTSTERRAMWNHEAYLVRYPRICALLVAASEGYVTPRAAGRVLLAADRHQDYHGDWVSSKYGDNARHAVTDAIACRHRGLWEVDGYQAALEEVQSFAGHPAQQCFKFASWH